MEVLAGIFFSIVIFIFSCELSGLGKDYRNKKRIKEEKDQEQELLKKHYETYKNYSDEALTKLAVQCSRECRAIMSAPIGKGIYQSYETKNALAKQKAVTKIIDERKAKKEQGGK